MRKHTMAVMISTILLGAAAAQAEPGAAGIEQQQTQSTSNPTTSTSTSTANHVAGTSDAAAKAKARWTQADADGNGTLSRAEVQASLPTMSESFVQMDANGDGKLSSDEMHAYKSKHGERDMRQQFSAADKDGDNMLDLAEASSMPKLSEQFAKVDVNQDGKVSIEELQADAQSDDAPRQKLTEVDCVADGLLFVFQIIQRRPVDAVSGSALGGVSAESGVIESDFRSFAVDFETVEGIGSADPVSDALVTADD
jgi:Ca2+-binding EF-hand superfamily protein